MGRGDGSETIKGLKPRRANKDKSSEKFLTRSDLEKMDEEDILKEIYKREEKWEKKIQKKHKKATGEDLDIRDCSPYKNAPVFSEGWAREKHKKMSVREKRSKYLSKKEREELEECVRALNKLIKENNEDYQRYLDDISSRSRSETRGLTRLHEEYLEAEWRENANKKKRSRFFWDYEA